MLFPLMGGRISKDNKGFFASARCCVTFIKIS
jgi:hypothetical protein